MPDEPSITTNAAPPRRALVLSAGGLFGAYQAGVWQELELFYQPDLVVGASIGSLNGWAIAGGATGAQLVEWWREIGPHQTAERIRWRFPRTWRGGVLDCRPLFGEIERFHAAWTRQRDFAVVATRLPQCRLTEYWNDEVTWRHLAASCAVPGVIDLQYLDLQYPDRPHLDLRRVGGAGQGRATNRRVTLGDGGLLDHRPLTPALRSREGARPDVVVLVDVLPGWPAGPLKAPVAAMRWLGGFKTPALNGTRLLTIAPTRYLGGPADSLYFDAGRLERWFDQGREDAARLKPLL